MITAICILILASFKDDISSLIDLYTTLQGNLKVYALNYFVTATLGSVEFFFDYWIIKQLDQNFILYMGLMTIVNVIGMIFAVYVISQKGRIKKFIRRKKLRKNMAKARSMRWDSEDYRDIEERCETLTKGEMR